MTVLVESPLLDFKPDSDASTTQFSDSDLEALDI